MNIQKNIIEMAHHIQTYKFAEHFGCTIACDDCSAINNCEAYNIAKYLVNKNYCLADEVKKETSDEIKQKLEFAQLNASIELKIAMDKRIEEARKEGFQKALQNLLNIAREQDNPPIYTHVNWTKNIQDLAKAYNIEIH